MKKITLIILLFTFSQFVNAQTKEEIIKDLIFLINSNTVLHSYENEKYKEDEMAKVTASLKGLNYEYSGRLMSGIVFVYNEIIPWYEICSWNDFGLPESEDNEYFRISLKHGIRIEGTTKEDKETFFERNFLKLLFRENNRTKDNYYSLIDLLNKLGKLNNCE
jgi:hypothetical protein